MCGELDVLRVDSVPADPVPVPVANKQLRVAVKLEGVSKRKCESSAFRKKNAHEAFLLRKM